MLAYRINHDNIAIIATFGFSAVVLPEDERNGVVRYFVTSGLQGTNHCILAEEFERDYVVTRKINEALGRFIVERR